MISVIKEKNRTYINCPCKSTLSEKDNAECINGTIFNIDRSVQGIGRRYANIVLKKADIPLSKRAGELTEDEVEKIITIMQVRRSCFDPRFWYQASRGVAGCCIYFKWMVMYFLIMYKAYKIVNLVFFIGPSLFIHSTMCQYFVDK